MNGFYEAVIEILKRYGYQKVRSKGSHEIWGNGTRHQTVSKNMPSRHTANAIMKQAGLPDRL
jgi:predicted RNA binding protein YcfA (HicA-like mRNA interferase family)